MQESFRDFMWRALYHPETGYYTRRVATVGARGDFSTSASLHPTLAPAIARWIIQQIKTTGVTDIIEIGGGDGSLMRALRKHLGWWWLLKSRFHMVEVSASLQAKQKALLGSRVCWHSSVVEALDATQGRALIYHNELMDAFPVNLLEFDLNEKAWREVNLTWEGAKVNEGLASVWQDARFSILQTTPGIKQRAELGADLHAWFRKWLPSWTAGAMLGIDYGETTSALYHRRPRGTLRGYLLQQRVEGHDLYQNVGRQDITADVCFTDVLQWLREEKNTEPAYETQGEFIKRMGLPSPTTLQEVDRAFKCISLTL
jgi:SAM-dependent MidA family methyltransferase